MSIPSEVLRQLDISESGDCEALLDMYDENLVWHGSYDQNKAQVTAVFRALYRAFPDLKYNWENVWGDAGHWGATQQITGTHTGVLDLNEVGMPIVLEPTGKKISLPPATYEVISRDGKLVEITDGSKGQTFYAMLSQLGVEVEA